MPEHSNGRSPEMKWWGWGDPARRTELPAPALARLRAVLDAPERRGEPVPLEAVKLEPSRLPGPARERLASAVGDERVRDDLRTRVLHAAGRSYPDLLRLRRGHAEEAPDAVVYPSGEPDLTAVLQACAEEGVAVVPFGGGTSVVGGVEPVRGPFESLIALDLARMAQVGEVDRRSLTVELGPGLRGPALEAALEPSGVTLGHFPQSFEYSTLGGWVATRSAGQASTGYGKIGELLLGARLVTPAGALELPAVPATAAGPDLRGLVAGSEGILGVIANATLKVRPLPVERRYEGWMTKGFAEGADAFRRLEQGGVAPDVARLSDEVETRLTMEMSGGGSLLARAGRAYVGARGYGEGCLVILGFEGERASVGRRAALAGRIMRSSGALHLGRGPGRAWERSRFAAPYLRDALLDHCIMVETLETAAGWSRLMDVYAAVREGIQGALAARGQRAIVMCHVSHLYPSGASLYFTFFAPQEENAELEQWQAAKSAATDAIVASGGTITHHHAVGRDHAAWLDREIGELGVGLVAAAKERLDPAGIMNPGKLLPVAVEQEAMR